MLSIPIGKLNGESVDVPDYRDMPESSQLGVVVYGATQYLNDGAASISLTVTVDGKKVRNPDYPDTTEGNAKFRRDVLEGVHGRRDKIANGTMGVRGGINKAAVARQFLADQGYTDAQIDSMLAGPKKGQKAA